MIRFIRFLPIAIFVAMLGGCAGFATQAYTPSQSDPIKEVLITIPAEFPKVRIGVAGNAGLMFGAVGGLAAGAFAQTEGERLDQMLNSQGGGYQKQLVSQLESFLAAKGIRTQTLAVARGSSRTGLVEDYKSLTLPKNADAILDIFVWEAGYGGTHPILDPENRPIIRLRAQLVSAKTLQVLYADDIFFGFTNPFMQAKEIKSPKQYYFPTVQALHEDKTRAVEGLQVAATEVARFLVNEITMPPNKTVSR